MTTRPIDKINARIRLGREYLRAVGWAKPDAGFQSAKGGPVDIHGALRYCADTDGYEVVAARMLASRGFDLVWNDLECLNLFDALRAFDHEFTNEDVAAVYGARSWYGIVGLLQLLTLTSEANVRGLAAHFGPADEAVVLAALARTGPSPAYDDAHLVLSRYGFDPRSWLMADALVANVLEFPHIDTRLAVVLAPVALKLGLA